MIAILLVAALQAAGQAAGQSPQAAAPVPEKFSVLVNAAPPCQRAPGSLTTEGDIVVCAPSDQQQRLPLRDDRGVPDGPTPSNRDLSGAGALAAGAEPCAIHGCTVGFGGPIVAAALKGAVDLGKKAFAKKVDKTGRVPIDLGDPTPPDLTGRVLP